MTSAPLGVVLAGGAGRRFGADGAKVAAPLGGRTLLARAVDALAAAVGEVVICARQETDLPGVDAIGAWAAALAVWREPADAPRHPLLGIAQALHRAGGERPILVCAVDLPFAGEGALAAVRDAAAGVVRAPLNEGEAGPVGEAAGAPIVVAAGQPLVGLYRPAVADALAAAAAEGAPVRATIARLGAIEVAVPRPARTLFNVNTGDDLRAAAARLASGA